MDRQRRITIVFAFAVWIAGGMVAFIAPAIVLVTVQPLPNDWSSADSITSQMSAFSQAMDVAWMISFIASVVSGVAFLYALGNIAAWFIGPTETSAVADAASTVL